MEIRDKILLPVLKPRLGLFLTQITFERKASRNLEICIHTYACIYIIYMCIYSVLFYCFDKIITLIKQILSYILPKANESNMKGHWLAK